MRGFGLALVVLLLTIPACGQEAPAKGIKTVALIDCPSRHKITQPVSLERPGLLAWIKICAETYGVEPEFALAVARIESGTKTERLRYGRLGRSKYYGPFGINRCFLKKWPIDDPYVNVEIGIKALRGADKRRVLKRYNAAFNESYFRAVMACYRQAMGGA